MSYKLWDGAKAAAISAEALAKLKEEVLKRFAIIRKANTAMNVIREKDRKSVV